jgi:hypothetical protein
MKLMNPRLIAAALALTALGSAPRASLAQGAGPVPAGAPTCGVVSGTGAVTFTLDEGKTLAPVATQLSGNHNTTGLVALDQLGSLLAESDGSLFASRDAGCTWSEVGTLNYSPVMLTSAGASRAYAWSDNNNYFARIDHGIHEVVVPVDNIIGVGVDPNDGRHVRIGAALGDVVESFDGGESWMRHGRAPAGDELTLAYRMTFDPKNVDHAVLGRSNDGAWVTFDGGVTWSRSRSGISGAANVFNFAISPADSNVVWAMGIVLSQTETGWGGRYIARSTDGGRTFAAVLRQTRSITLRNGPVMTAHPTDPNLLYFVFGTYFANYGTDIYKFDARTGQTVTRHNQAPDVNALVFSKQTPSVMYFGLESHGGF